MVYSTSKLSAYNVAIYSIWYIHWYEHSINHTSPKKGRIIWHPRALITLGHFSQYKTSSACIWQLHDEMLPSKPDYITIKTQPWPTTWLPFCDFPLRHWILHFRTWIWRKIEKRQTFQKPWISHPRVVNSILITSWSSLGWLVLDRTHALW